MNLLFTYFKKNPKKKNIIIPKEKFYQYHLINKKKILQSIFSFLTENKIIKKKNLS